MNKLLKTLVVATSLALPMSAAAVTTPQSPFQVTVNLTASCAISLPATNFTFNVVSNQAYAGSTLNQNVSVTCTQGVGYQVELDGGVANVPGTAAGIPYTVSFPTYTGFTGTGAAATHVLSAAVAAGTYAGDCTALPIAAGVCSQTRTHNITVTF